MGFESRKHSGVHAVFGEHFAKPHLIDPKYHCALLVAFARRVQGDYIFDAVITEDQVMDTIATAREFLDVARRFFQVKVNEIGSAC